MPFCGRFPKSFSWVQRAVLAVLCAFGSSAAGESLTLVPNPTAALYPEIEFVDVSAAGDVAIGWCNSETSYQLPFRWSREAGFEFLTIDGGDYGRPVRLTDDGVMVAGYVVFPNAGIAFMWNKAGASRVLAGFGRKSAFVAGLSEVGTTAGQVLTAKFRFRAVRWSKFGLTDLGALPHHDNSAATAISRDGGTIVGYSWEDALDPEKTRYRPVRWVHGGWLERLSLGEGERVFPVDVSDSGGAIAGIQTPLTHHIWPRWAVRWTPSGGWIRIGSLPGLPDTEARSISSDGRIIVGNAFDHSDPVAHAFRWTEWSGMEDLNERYRGLIPPGIVLKDARGISRDGRFIVGTAYRVFYGSDYGFLLDTQP